MPRRRMVDPEIRLRLLRLPKLLSQVYQFPSLVRRIMLTLYWYQLQYLLKNTKLLFLSRIHNGSIKYSNQIKKPLFALKTPKNIVSFIVFHPTTQFILNLFKTRLIFNILPNSSPRTIKQNIRLFAMVPNLDIQATLTPKQPNKLMLPISHTIIIPSLRCNDNA